MRWISNVNRQSVLPILFGISLTTFGLSVAILLYTMLEKDNDDDKKKRDKIVTSKRKEISLSFKIPEKYVSAVIGKGGTTIKKVEELTNTRIRMEKENFSSERVCCIRSDDINNIDSAQNMIQNIINNLPAIETYELFVPFEASREVFKIERNRIEFVQEIQRTYGAKVILEAEPHKTETGLKRRIILKGTAEQIAPAIIQIEDKVQQKDRVQLSLDSVRKQRKPSSRNTVVGNILDDHSDVEVYELLVPREACERIIERDKHTVHEMEKSSGATIMIDEYKFESDVRKVLIFGTAKEIELAIVQIENKVKEANESRNELNPEWTIKRVSDSPCNNDTSTSGNVSKLALEQDGLMEVYISAMETPSLFWIQVVGPANVDLQDLVDDMTKYYNEEENRQLHILKKITPGQMVAAKFKYDGKWYRAEVLSVIMESSEYKVFFVDYGDLEIVPIDDILELRTDMLSLRLQAVECSLANVKPRESEWSPEASDKFAELTHLAKWEPLVAKVKGYKERPVGYGVSRRQKSLIPCIDLYDNDKNINVGDSLIQLEMAQIEEEIHSVLNSSLAQDKCDLPFVPFLSDSICLD